MEGHGQAKFPGADLLLTSTGRGWRGLSAELRRHAAGEIPDFVSRQMEITLAVRGAPQSLVHRSGNGHDQTTAVRTGTLWFCPIGVHESSIRITAPLQEILHIYYPEQAFAELSAHHSRPVTPHDIPYLADIEDEFVRQICFRVLAELQRESPGGRLLLESLSNALLIHILGHTTNMLASDHSIGSLDPRRLQRVTDFIAAHLAEELTLDQLADVACLSRFHFARAFRRATGMPPHRYVSQKRIEHARSLLSQTRMAIADIALNCRFSSQAGFTRAFRTATGVSPAAYRAGCRP
jgi:AraC family transcriptional regulator